VAATDELTSAPRRSGAVEEPEGHVSLAGLLLRNWRVSTPILILTAMACGLVQTSAPATFAASGTVMLATPAQDPSRLPAAIIELSEAIDEMQRFEVRESLAVGNASVSARLVDRTILVITSSADDGRDAERSVTGAIRWLETELTSRQEAAGITEQDRLTGRLLTPTVIARRLNDDSYAAEAVVWVDGLGGAEENPFDASPSTARLLLVALSGVEGRGNIEDRIGPDVDYAISQDETEDLSGLVIVTEGADADDTIAAFDAIVSVMDLELAGRQTRAQVPVVRRVFVDVLSRPEVATDESPSVHPASVLIACLGVAAAGGAGALDRRRQRPRRPRSAHRHMVRGVRLRRQTVG
jgi:hypothetical protein